MAEQYREQLLRRRDKAAHTTATSDALRESHEQELQDIDWACRERALLDEDLNRRKVLASRAELVQPYWGARQPAHVHIKRSLT